MLRRVHRWLGLILSLPLLAITLSGLFMAAAPFFAALDDDVSPSGSLREPHLPVDTNVIAVFALARSAAPGLLPVRWRPISDRAVAIDFSTRGRLQPVVRIIVDALDNRVIAECRGPDGVYRWMHALHEGLLMGPTGRALVGGSGLLLLLLGLSGVLIWWPPRRRWRSGFLVSHRASGFRLQRELHGVTGFWWLGLLLLQSVSGITLAFPETARAVAGLPSLVPRLVQPDAVTRAASVQTMSPPGQPTALGTMDDAFRVIAAGVAAAQSTVPGAVLLDLRRPAMPGRPMLALLLPPGRSAGSPPALVAMDPVSARVLAIQTPGTVAAAGRVLGWLRAIHEGGVAGPVGRLMMCLFGMSLLLLPITGATMWIMRHRRHGRAQFRPEQASCHGHDNAGKR